MENIQTVLIVDDIVDNLNLVANTLIKENLNVILAQSGVEAIKNAGKYFPDLILLDIMMPNMDGFEVCRVLKNDKQTRHIPVIFLTALGETESIVKALEVGGVDFISKPFNIVELLARVKTHLSISRMTKEIEKANINLEKKVEERTFQLLKMNKELELEISQRKAVENKLKINNDKLVISNVKAQESDRLKTEFLNNISHEIRTPMNGIVGFLDFLDTPDLPENSRKEYINIIRESSNQLLDIVSDIIAISKINAQQEKIAKQNIAIDALINDLISTYDSKAKDKGITIIKKQTTKDTSLVVNTDNKLKLILEKLLDNAIKYTQEGYIELGFNLKNKFIEFYVKDTGIGIDADKHEEIFEQFRQLDSNLTREYVGAGLGLTIAKAYTQILGGKMWLSSEKGQGTIFYFTIPYEPIIDTL